LQHLKNKPGDDEQASFYTANCCIALLFFLQGKEVLPTADPSRRFYLNYMQHYVFHVLPLPNYHFISDLRIILKLLRNSTTITIYTINRNVKPNGTLLPGKRSLWNDSILSIK
jgi:hypothetical protein